MKNNDVQSKLNKEIIKIEEESVDVIPLVTIKEILSIFKKIDTDMIPVLDAVSYMIENMPDEKTRSLSLRMILRYYGFFGNTDILTTRQKLFLIDKTGKLGKKPFLKEKDKDCINTLLKGFGIFK